MKIEDSYIGRVAQIFQTYAFSVSMPHWLRPSVIADINKLLYKANLQHVKSYCHFHFLKYASHSKYIENTIKFYFYHLQSTISGHIIHFGSTCWFLSSQKVLNMHLSFNDKFYGKETFPVTSPDC